MWCIISTKMIINCIYLSLFTVVCVTVATPIGNEGVNREVTYEDVLQSTKDPNVLLIDVRRPEEIAATGIIPSAINVPFADLRDALSNMSNEAFLQKYHRDKPNMDSQIIVYCQTGGRAQQALNIALELGYFNARAYLGSWEEWSEKQKANAASIANPNQQLLVIVGVALISLAPFVETFTIK